MRIEFLIPVAFILFFIFIFSNVLALLSLISGWRKLSLKSPSPEYIDPSAARYSMQSMRLGFVNYNRCVTVRFTSAGVSFSLFWPFSFMHGPFIIRYGTISVIKTGSFFGPYITFSSGEKKIMLRGKSATELEKRIQQNQV